VAGMALLFFKVLRVPGRPRLVLSMAVVIGYCVLTGAAIPVVRATVMTTVFFFAFLRERPPLFGHVLSLAAFAVLLWDPASLFSVSFQLSFLSVVSIVTLVPRLDPTPWIKRRWRPSHPLYGILRYPLTLMAVSFSAWIGIAPLSAATFGTLSLYGIAANILAVPLAMGIIGSGSLTLATELFFRSGAAVTAAACTFLLEAQVAWNLWIAHRPMAQVHPDLPPAWAFALYAVMGLGVLCLSRRKDE
jgi:competence protein ComEC